MGSGFVGGSEFWFHFDLVNPTAKQGVHHFVSIQELTDHTVRVVGYRTVKNGSLNINGYRHGFGHPC